MWVDLSDYYDKPLNVSFSSVCWPSITHEGEICLACGSVRCGAEQLFGPSNLSFCSSGFSRHGTDEPSIFDGSKLFAQSLFISWLE